LVIVKREHALKTLGVIQDINVLEGDVALCVSLTGFARVGSEILTEDENLFHKIELETEFPVSISVSILCLRWINCKRLPPVLAFPRG